MESKRQELKSLIRDTKLFIGGCFVEAGSGKLFPTYDPSSGECIAQVCEGDEQDADLAVRAARKAFDEGPWPRLPGSERGKVVYKFAELIEQRADELAKLESFNNGMPLSMSKRIVLVGASYTRYYAGWADKITGTTAKMEGSFHGYTLCEPIGVVAAITPWNFPVVMFLVKVSAALVCGNTVIVKPAEQTPLTSLMLARLAMEAGVPPGVLNVVPGYGPTCGAALARHMDVDKISFTGSTEVGRIVMKLAAESNLKPVTLELGGKSPIIICEDADLDMAVEISHNAVFMHSGQVCLAGSRVYVQEGVYDEFVEKAVSRAKQRVIGDAMNTDVNHGPQVSQEQLDKVLSYIQSGKDEGARLVTGGNLVGKTGYFIEPTIFVDLKETMKISREEIFGPVLSVGRFRTLDEAIKLANNTQYGLGAAIFTKDIDKANTFSRSVKAGLVHINTYFNRANLPYGGYKMSGIGREYGYDGLLPFLQTKSIVVPLKDSPWL